MRATRSALTSRPKVSDNSIIEQRFNLPPQDNAGALAARTIADLAGLVTR